MCSENKIKHYQRSFVLVTNLDISLQNHAGNLGNGVLEISKQSLSLKEHDQYIKGVENTCNGVTFVLTKPLLGLFLLPPKIPIKMCVY